VNASTAIATQNELASLIAAHEITRRVVKQQQNERRFSSKIAIVHGFARVANARDRLRADCPRLWAQSEPPDDHYE
jgi:cellobiose-specific phosphotransferase system component IIA